MSHRYPAFGQKRGGGGGLCLIRKPSRCDPQVPVDIKYFLEFYGANKPCQTSGSSVTLQIHLGMLFIPQRGNTSALRKSLAPQSFHIRDFQCRVPRGPHEIEVAHLISARARHTGNPQWRRTRLPRREAA